MAHDPKAQEVLKSAVRDYYGANQQQAARASAFILYALGDAGLIVVSDASEPSDAELRAAALETARQRVTFTGGSITDPWAQSRHSGGGSCGLLGCACMERP